MSEQLARPRRKGAPARGERPDAQVRGRELRASDHAPACIGKQSVRTKKVVAHARRTPRKSATSSASSKRATLETKRWRSSRSWAGRSRRHTLVQQERTSGSRTTGASAPMVSASRRLKRATRPGRRGIVAIEDACHGIPFPAVPRMLLLRPRHDLDDRHRLVFESGRVSTMRTTSRLSAFSSACATTFFGTHRLLAYSGWRDQTLESSRHGLVHPVAHTVPCGLCARRASCSLIVMRLSLRHAPFGQDRLSARRGPCAPSSSPWGSPAPRAA